MLKLVLYDIFSILEVSISCLVFKLGVALIFLKNIICLQFIVLTDPLLNSIFCHKLGPYLSYSANYHGSNTSIAIVSNLGLCIICLVYKLGHFLEVS